MNSKQKGSGQHRVRLVVLGALLACGAVTAVKAETLPGTPIFQSTTMVTAPNINLTQLDLTTPGTLLVSLTDLKWPAAMDLSFTLFDTGHVIHPEHQDGSDLWSYNITAPAKFFGAVFATPKANAGLYNVQINFQGAAPVPLPAAGWFLLSGIAGLAALRPKQKLSQTFA